MHLFKRNIFFRTWYLEKTIFYNKIEGNLFTFFSMAFNASMYTHIQLLLVLLIIKCFFTSSKNKYSKWKKTLQQIF